MKAQRSPTEVTTKFATTVYKLTDVWTFIMNHADMVGPTPHITITPRWVHDDEDHTNFFFEVSVSGMIERDGQ